MSTGFWANQDGLPLQFGTQKAIPELGGDYLLYGENREIETYISLGATSFGNNALQIPALPSSFSGTSTPIAAGIQSLTTFIPLQVTAPVTGGSSAGVLTLANPQIWFDKVELECLITANAGTGGATGLTGIGLVTMQQSGATSQFVQVAPNAGVQLFGSITNAAMTAGATYTYRANALNSAGTGGAGYLQYSTANTATVTAPQWIGSIPLTTTTLSGVANTTLANSAWISTIAAGGVYTGTSAAGLLKLRINYTILGTIVQ